MARIVVLNNSHRYFCLWLTKNLWADVSKNSRYTARCDNVAEGPARSWDTGKWQCDYCDFEFDDADFTQDLSDKHRKACLYRGNSGSPFRCKDCDVPVCVKKEHLLHYRTYPYGLKCQDRKGRTADASVQTDLPVHGKKQKKGKGPGQQEGQAKKEGPSSRAMA